MKVHLVKAIVFPVVIYGYKSWTIKKVGCQRIDAFELWCWRGLLRVPWTVWRSNQSILKEIKPEYSLEGLMLKLKLNTFASLREELTPKDPDAGKDWRREQKGTTEDEMVGWHYWLNGHEFEKTQGVSDAEKSEVLQFMGSQTVGHDLATEQQQLHWWKAVLGCHPSSRTLSGADTWVEERIDLETIKRWNW